MFYKFSRLIILAAIILISSSFAFAQFDSPDSSSPGGKPNKDDYPKNVQESLAKGRIEREKKDYAELLQNGEEAAKLSDTLEKNFARSSNLSSEDQKNLDRLEKLAKKIRRELGADNADDAAEDLPSSMSDAFKYLQNSTSQLVDELKKTTRYNISVVAVQSSNSFLKVIKFIRLQRN